MRTFASPLVAACISLPAIAGEAAPPKTNSSLPIEEELLSQRPYSLNGVVTTDSARGSGFVAHHPNLFITAAHVLYDDEAPKWVAPPMWHGGVHSATDPGAAGIEARGYFRWVSYANQVGLSGTNSPAAFAKDVALVWAFEPFTAEEPATLDLKGASKLRSGTASFITGYPAIVDYTDEDGNFFLHSTAEETIRYKSAKANYLQATHISTGPGNSGGPVWVSDGEEWKAGGILVSGRPSEAGLYGFTSDIKSLLKAAEPVLAEPVRSSKIPSSVGSSSRIGVLKKPVTIPDGRHKWTKIPLNIGGFPEGATVSKVRLSLTITTAHRGDLVVALGGPGGTFAIIHDGEGAGADDLVVDDLSLTGDFTGGQVNGKWELGVQDRLTGDIAVVTQFQLEIGAD